MVPTLQFWENKILHVGGKLAMHADCCCEGIDCWNQTPVEQKSEFCIDFTPNGSTLWEFTQLWEVEWTIPSDMFDSSVSCVTPAKTCDEENDRVITMSPITALYWRYQEAPPGICSGFLRIWADYNIVCQPPGGPKDSGCYEIFRWGFTRDLGAIGDITEIIYSQATPLKTEVQIYDGSTRFIPYESESESPFYYFCDNLNTDDAELIFREI